MCVAPIMYWLIQIKLVFFEQPAMVFATAYFFPVCESAGLDTMGYHSAHRAIVHRQHMIKEGALVF